MPCLRREGRELSPETTRFSRVYGGQVGAGFPVVCQLTWNLGILVRYGAYYARVPAVGCIIRCYPRACEDILVGGISSYLSPWLPRNVPYIVFYYLTMASRGILSNLSLIGINKEAVLAHWKRLEQEVYRVYLVARYGKGETNAARNGAPGVYLRLLLLVLFLLKEKKSCFCFFVTLYIILENRYLYQIVSFLIFSHRQRLFFLEILSTFQHSFVS